MKLKLKLLRDNPLIVILGLSLFVMLFFTNTIITVIVLSISDSNEDRLESLGLVFLPGYDGTNVDHGAVLNCLHGGTCPEGVYFQEESGNYPSCSSATSSDRYCTSDPVCPSGTVRAKTSTTPLQKIIDAGSLCCPTASPYLQADLLCHTTANPIPVSKAGDICPDTVMIGDRLIKYSISLNDPNTCCPFELRSFSQDWITEVQPGTSYAWDGGFCIVGTPEFPSDRVVVDVVTQPQAEETEIEELELEEIKPIEVEPEPTSEPIEEIEPTIDQKDTDNDGIINNDDDCVFNPETYNGFTDEDGCPETNADSNDFEIMEKIEPKVTIENLIINPPTYSFEGEVFAYPEQQNLNATVNLAIIIYIVVFVILLIIALLVVKTKYL